jgi:hypothetical protein
VSGSLAFGILFFRLRETSDDVHSSSPLYCKYVHCMFHVNWPSLPTGHTKLKTSVLVRSPKVSTWMGDRLGKPRAVGIYSGTRGSVDGRGSMLQAERSLVRVPMRSLIFFNLPNPSSRTRPCVTIVSIYSPPPSPSLLVLTNNKASNKHPHPTRFFRALGPGTEHLPTALEPLEWPLSSGDRKL